ncbi:MAG: hypothetical protein JWN70_3552 [Planctomycetaceae bacterium]|nr:hypothetical protein [Planctomycetaceae bacterium]
MSGNRQSATAMILEFDHQRSLPTGEGHVLQRPTVVSKMVAKRSISDSDLVFYWIAIGVGDLPSPESFFVLVRSIGTFATHVRP